MQVHPIQPLLKAFSPPRTARTEVCGQHRASHREEQNLFIGQDASISSASEDALQLCCAEDNHNFEIIFLLRFKRQMDYYNLICCIVSS